MNKALAMILAVLAFAAFAVDTNRVTMTRLGSLNPRSGEVVTDVTFEGLADATNVYTKAETEEKIVELALGKTGDQTIVGESSDHPYFKIGFDATWPWLEFGEFNGVKRVYSPHNSGTLAVLSDIPPSVSNIVTKAYVENLGITLEETDPVWNAEKSDYATKADLSTGQITVNSAEYAESAHDAYNADYATLAEGLRDGPTEIYANTIFSRLDAAATTNAQQTAALDHKLDLAGGTMTGNLVMGYNSLFQINGGGKAKFQFSWGSALDNLIISAYRETSGSYSIRFPTSEGLLALTSDIPTSMAWDAITGKPTTISGYGITDALKSDFTSLTNNAAFTSAVAAVSPPTDLTHVEAEIETNRTAIATLSARAYIEVVSADEVYYVFTTNQE